MVMMSYSYYILLMGEVNKYMYNYSILANCRARTERNKNTRDKIDKNQSENLQKLYRICCHSAKKCFDNSDRSCVYVYCIHNLCNIRADM